MVTPVVSYEEKIRIVRQYYSMEFKTRKRFNTSQKSIITRRYNKIINATQGEFRFIKKTRGYVSTNKGSFVPVPSKNSITDGRTTVTGGLTFYDIRLPRKMVMGLITGQVGHAAIQAFIDKDTQLKVLRRKNNRFNYSVLYQGRTSPYSGPSDFTTFKLLDRYLAGMNDISADKIIGVRVTLWADKTVKRSR